MNTRAEPPENRGMGCFGKGCLILIASGILLVVGGIGGTYWSLRHVYLSDKPAPIPETTTPSETTGAATLGQTSVATPSEKSAVVRERLDTMKQAARAHEATDVDLTAEDINALIAANRKSRGTASVGINDTALQAQLSIPLERLDLPFRNGTSSLCSGMENCACATVPSIPTDAVPRDFRLAAISALMSAAVNSTPVCS